MKMTNILRSVAAVFCGVLLWGCQQKEQLGEARAVAASETYVVFDAKSAPEKVLSVYADGAWAVDVDSEWITVSPMRGAGAGEITVSVTDNVTGTVTDRPREGIITLQGGSVERNAKIIVHQNGDTYYGVQEYTLAQLRELEVDDVAKVARAQVVALSQKGFIASDASGCLYVQGTGVKLGDVLAFNGKRIEVNGAPAFELDECEVKSHSEVVRPEAKDITSILPTYDTAVAEYVSLSASLVGTNIWISADVQIPVLDPLESLELSKLDLHKVVLKGYGVGLSMLVTSVEDQGADEALIPYPLRFLVRVDGINYTSATWSATSRIQPVQGLGYIEYVPFDLATTDGNQKYKLDVSDKSPRVTGPWPGDYWLFYGNGAIKAGSEVHIAFEARTSATGHKFWILEFLDGSEWRPAGETFTTTEPGEEVVYTHAMNADGATNVQADQVVKYRKNTEHAQFRFRCVANWQASGAGKLAARNGGSARLTVTDVADATYQPTIEILKEGNGVEKDPVYANIEVSTELLTFNGTPGAPKTITVQSDYDFTVSTSADWLSFDVAEGLAGESVEIQVTCAQSELPELRQGTIKIVSEDSEKVINVVQSAAGQQLDPFVSISGGNTAEVNELEGSVQVKVQANVEVSAETADAWIKVEAAPDTKALVEWTEFTVSYEANESAEPRTGTIRFFNEKEKVESMLTLVQSGKEPEPIYPEGVYFQDDFEWLAPYIKAWVEANPGDAEKLDPVSSNLASHSQPNIWNVAALTSSVGAELEKRGYTDLNKSAKTLYMQKNYFKMGATNKHTGLQLPAIKFGTTPVDADLSFDWCAHMTGAGVIDKVTITVEIVEGPGKFSDTGTKLSAEIATAQEANQLAWQHAKVKLVGVTDDTRIQIHPTHYNDGAGASQQRWHLDNIKVAEPEASVEVGTALWTEWWQGGAANQAPSAYSASGTRTTKTFGNASVTYTEGGSTSLKADGLVYYNTVDNIANEDYRYNLLIAKSGGYLEASGIPCKGVKTAQLTYRSNYQLASHQVTSSTSGVTIGELSATSVPKLDLDSKNTYTITCTVTIAEGVENLNLRITDISSTANIRVDGIELVVTEVQ